MSDNKEVQSMIFFVEALGFKYKKVDGDHVVTGYGFSKRHASMTCIINRIGNYIESLATKPSVCRNCRGTGTDEGMPCMECR